MWGVIVERLLAIWAAVHGLMVDSGGYFAAGAVVGGVVFVSLLRAATEPGDY